MSQPQSNDAHSRAQSEASRAFTADLRRVAGAEVTVLIEGEPGSGKSLAARTLHEHSPRAAGPFVVADLAALAPSLIEAELFGHEEGAFTGADRARPGRFRRATGGTLVLEGVEELPPELQVKLLRVLQEKVVEPLGGEGPVTVDARVVATSARDLAGEVREGRFREDLYYRLAVVVLTVPPLRARATDLAGLAQAIAKTVAARTGVPPRRLDAGALARLEEHAWPGNVRELENALERVTVLAPPDDEGRPAPVTAEEFDFLGEAVAGAAERLAAQALAHGLTLDRIGLAVMEAALQEQRGNLSAAARRLGLSRRAFEYRLSKLRSDTPGSDTPSADTPSDDTPSDEASPEETP